MRVTEPYKKANRKYHPDDTVIDLGNGSAIGGEKLAVIAGPCSVESETQIVEVAEAVQKSWPHFFEAIKPLGAEVEYAG